MFRAQFPLVVAGTGGRVLLTEILLPRIARQRTVCVTSIRGQARKARFDKFEFDEGFQRGSEEQGEEQKTYLIQKTPKRCFELYIVYSCLLRGGKEQGEEAECLLRHVSKITLLIIHIYIYIYIYVYIHTYIY